MASSTLIEDVASGAAMGAPFGGPVGAAIGGLGGVLMHYAPDLINSISGQPVEEAVKAAQAAVSVVEAVTGTTDPQAAREAANASDEVALQLRVELSRIAADLRRAEIESRDRKLSAQLEARDKQRATELADLSRRLDDVADARRTMASLAERGSRIAWAPTIITAIVIVGFFGLSVLILTKSITDSSAALLLVGALVAMTKDCVNYWTGSTNAGNDTRKQLVELSHRAADAAPAAVIAARKADAETLANHPQEVAGDPPFAGKARK